MLQNVNYYDWLLTHTGIQLFFIYIVHPGCKADMNKFIPAAHVGERMKNNIKCINNIYHFPKTLYVLRPIYLE